MHWVYNVLIIENESHCTVFDCTVVRCWECWRCICVCCGYCFSRCVCICLSICLDELEKDFTPKLNEILSNGCLVLETLDNSGIKKYQMETLCFKARLFRFRVAFSRMHTTFPLDNFSFQGDLQFPKRYNCSVKFGLATTHCYSRVTERFLPVVIFWLAVWHSSNAGH